MTIQEHSKPKPNLTDLQTDQINILEQIGKVSAANIKIKLLVEQLEKQTIAEIEKSFNNWVVQLPIKLTETSKKWSSAHSYWTSRDKLVNSYCYQFRENLSTLLKQWVAEDLEKIVKSYAINIYNQIRV
jgi:adenylosuccinate lyase